MTTNVRFCLSHLKAFKPILTLLSPNIFPQKLDVVYSNVITNDGICAPFVTTLL